MAERAEREGTPIEFYASNNIDGGDEINAKLIEKYQPAIRHLQYGLPEEETVKAGIGKAELTPPLGVELAGYGYYLGRRAARVKDPLFARAVLVEDGQARWLLISCDVLGLSRKVSDAVFEGLSARFGIEKDAVMLVSIHTHTGPAIKYHEGCGEVDADYPDTVPGIILEACALAIADAAPVEYLLRCENAIAPGFAYNRTDDAGPLDDMVRGFYFTRAEKRPIAVISYACHPVLNGRLDAISADYPGRVHALCQEAGIESIYINGLCGDIDPVYRKGEDRDARMDAFAAAIVEAFTKGLAPCEQQLKTGRIPRGMSLEYVVECDIVNAVEDAVKREGAEESGAARVARIWEKEMLAKLYPYRLPREEHYEVAYACLGGMWVVALPFEGYTLTGQIMRERAQAPVIALGCAEELLGYLPTRKDTERGAYAALESMFPYKRLPARTGAAELLGEGLGDSIAKGFRKV